MRAFFISIFLYKLSKYLKLTGANLMKFSKYIEMLLESETEMKKISKDPTYKEMLKFLKSKAKAYEASDFDIESAIYWYSSEYHSGQNSNLYSALSTTEYKPGRSAKDVTSDGFAAVELYNELCSKFGGTVIECKND